MHTDRKFRPTWFWVAIVAAIIVGEVVAWGLASKFGLRANPLVVGFVSVGIVAGITSVLYEGCDIG